MNAAVSFAHGWFFVGGDIGRSLDGWSDHGVGTGLASMSIDGPGFISYSCCSRHEFLLFMWPQSLEGNG
jgi:hypothetical protein